MVGKVSIGKLPPYKKALLLRDIGLGPMPVTPEIARQVVREGLKLTEISDAEFLRRFERLPHTPQAEDTF